MIQFALAKHSLSALGHSFWEISMCIILQTSEVFEIFQIRVLKEKSWWMETLSLQTVENEVC